MKKMMLALVALFAVSVAAVAQNNDNEGRRRPDAKEMAKAQAERMAERYGLNDEQTAKVEALNAEYAGKMRPQGGMRGGMQRPRGQRPEAAKEQMEAPKMGKAPSKEDMEARRKEMQAQQEAYQAALKEIMTKEQYAKYGEDMKRMQERGNRSPRRERRSE